MAVRAIAIEGGGGLGGGQAVLNLVYGVAIQQGASRPRQGLHIVVRSSQATTEVLTWTSAPEAALYRPSRLWSLRWQCLAIMRAVGVGRGGSHDDE